MCAKHCVVLTSLSPARRQQWGKFYVYRDYNNHMYITMAVEGTSSQQAFFEFNSLQAPPTSVNISILPGFDFNWPVA